MEERLKQKINNAISENNNHAIIEAYNGLATYYENQLRYKDAIEQYNNAINYCQHSELKLERAKCLSKIGEMYILLSDFATATNFKCEYLAIAKELKNNEEMQKANRSVGVVFLYLYLQQRGSSNVSGNGTHFLNISKDYFEKSLSLNDQLTSTIKQENRARLFLDLAVVHGHLESFDISFNYIKNALKLITDKMPNVKHLCFITKAQVSIQNKDEKDALNCLNKALEIADKLKDDKILLMCETLSLRAEIFYKNSEYMNAKRDLIKAHKLESPDEIEKNKIESNLRIVAAMCQLNDYLRNTDKNDHAALKKLYENLGDGASKLRNFEEASKHYLKMLEHAEKAGDSGKTLGPIYVSLFQTYKDMKCYDKALEYYQKEYELIKDDPKEAVVTLSGIAEVLALAKKPYEEVEQACERARQAAQARKDIRSELKVLQNQLKYQEQYKETVKKEVTLSKIIELAGNVINPEEISQEVQGDTPSQEMTQNIGDDICLDDLTDDEEDAAEKENRKRKRRASGKKNNKSEAKKGNKSQADDNIARSHSVNESDNSSRRQLHEACTSGLAEQVFMLIMEGADVNASENFNGNTPLHVAAKYGHLETVKILLDRGGDPSLQNKYGSTPLEVLTMWRAGTNLTHDRASLYDELCKLMNDTNEVDKSPNSKSAPVDDVQHETISFPCASTSKTPVDYVRQEKPTGQETRKQEKFTSDEVQDNANSSLSEVEEVLQDVTAQEISNTIVVNNKTPNEQVSVAESASVHCEADSDGAVEIPVLPRDCLREDSNSPTTATVMQDEITRENTESEKDHMQQDEAKSKNVEGQQSVTLKRHHEVNNDIVSKRVKLAEYVSVHIQTDHNDVLANELSRDDLQVIIEQKLNAQMSANEAKILLKAIENKLDDLHERHWQEAPAEPMPKCFLLEEASRLKFQCNDERSLKWLHSTVNRLQGLWEGNTGFVVLQETLVDKYIKAKVWVPNVSSLDAAKIKHYLEIQNPKHNIATWPLYQHDIVQIQDGACMILTVGISPVEKQKLLDAKNSISYRFGTLIVDVETSEE